MGVERVEAPTSLGIFAYGEVPTGDACQHDALRRVQGQSPWRVQGRALPAGGLLGQPLTFSVPTSTEGLTMLPWEKSRSLAKATMDFNTS